MIRRAAFASSDGRVVDTHFGLANTFFVYDVGSSTPPVLVEKRRNFRLPGQFGPEVPKAPMAHHRDELERVAELLRDCDAVFVVRIGAGPADFLLERGFRVFQIEAEIGEIAEAIRRENESEMKAKENV
jgi:predicted Fe-Mo cluster-binding NifX family protein